MKTAKELCEKYKIHRATLEYWLAQKLLLPHYKRVNGKVMLFIDENELIDILKKKGRLNETKEYE